MHIRRGYAANDVRRTSTYVHFENGAPATVTDSADFIHAIKLITSPHFAIN